VKLSGSSIQTKVNLSLAAVFLLVLISSLTTIYQSESSLANNVARKTTTDTASSYFDSINILMLSGAMNNRQSLQEKILTNDDLNEARIIRGDAVSSVYGPGSADSAIIDDLDRRAMKGESIIEEINNDQGHFLTVVTPMKALSSYKGTNCLLCHQVPEGTVLGAVRVTYDFANLDTQINNNVMKVAFVELALFIAGLIVISLLLRRIVLQPVNRLSKTISDIDKNADLSQRIKVTSNDEIGQMSTAFNSMLQSFHDSLNKVSTTIHKLGSSSSQINEIATLANDAVRNQQIQTSAVAAAMEQMEVATRSVEASAESTVSASELALKESTNGTSITTDAIGAIEGLKQEIDGATTVIHKLDEQSQNVGTVLEVIQKIAEQTNLLALNAAIEAARAGEQGRGFAVVADEVRTLASRTRNSTEEINAIIEALQHDARDAVNVMQRAHQSAEDGVAQVQGTSNALSNIAEEVRVINDMNHQVASSVKEQTQMAASVESSVTEIAKTSEHTSSRAGKLNQVAHELGSLASELEILVQRFKL
jgi:methyl-accepting chemotaxis protein